MSDYSTEFRAGASACLAIVSSLEGLFQGGPDNDPIDRYYALQDTARAAILATAGDLPPRAAGALSLLAELLVFREQNGGSPDLDRWIPEATMTDEARQASRQAFAAQVAGDAAEDEAKQAFERFKAGILADRGSGESA